MGYYEIYFRIARGRYDLSIKIAGWPIQLDTCQIRGTRKPRHVRKPSLVADGPRRNVYLLKIGTKSFRDGSQDICKDTESNLGPFAGF